MPPLSDLNKCKHARDQASSAPPVQSSPFLGDRNMSLDSRQLRSGSNTSRDPVHCLGLEGVDQTGVGRTGAGVANSGRSSAGGFAAGRRGGGCGGVHRSGAADAVCGDVVGCSGFASGHSRRGEAGGDGAHGASRQSPVGQEKAVSAESRTFDLVSKDVRREMQNTLAAAIIAENRLRAAIASQRVIEHEGPHESFGELAWVLASVKDCDRELVAKPVRDLVVDILESRVAHSGRE